jgi:hypothetical protein
MIPVTEAEVEALVARDTAATGPSRKVTSDPR